MAKYTTEVRSICESMADYEESHGFNDVDSIITKAAPKIFGTNWPIFDENYRLTLETLILRHYYTREISEETVGLWRLRLNDKMNMIMPYYNQLYKSATLEFNPLYDVDVFETSTRKTDTTSENTGTSDETSNINRTVEETDKKTGDETYGKGGDITDGKKGKETTTDNQTTTNDLTQTLNVNDTTDTNSTDTTNERYAGTSTGETTGKTTVDRSLDDSQWHLYSDTPQGSVIGIANAEGSVGDNTYLTNAQHDTDVLKEDTTTNTQGTTSDTASGTDEITKIGTSKVTSKGTDTTTNTGTVEVNGDGNKEYNEDTTRNYNEQGNKQYNDNGTKNITDTTNGNKNINTSGNSTINGLEDYTNHVSGKRGNMTYSKMLTEFRDTFININKMVVDELSTLFFGLW